jgi:hypothetical protein
MPLQDLAKIRKKREKDEAAQVGLPAAPIKDTSRRTGRITTKPIGFQGTSRREGAATLKKFPGVAEGIEPAGVGRGFSKFMAKDSAKTLQEGGDVVEDVTTGIPSNVTVLQSPKQRAAQGLAPARPQPSLSFGLPTDRLPSFSELGGAIGQMFRHVGGIAKKRRALGLIPGRRTTTTAGRGLQGKDLANILVKQLEAATLAGNKEKAAEIETQLEGIINPEKADLAAIDQL